MFSALAYRNKDYYKDFGIYSLFCTRRYYSEHSCTKNQYVYMDTIKIIIIPNMTIYGI